MASQLLTGVRAVASEPLLTGGLLYLLTRGPFHLRERLLSPFQDNLLAVNGAARLGAFVTLLKVLTGLGVWRRLNQALTSLALNNWAFGRKPGAPFKFGPGKEELVIITGGSSGFGYEMVKAFSKVATVVALDVSAFPPELAQLPDVHFYKCDVTDTPAVESLCKEIRQTHGEATVLINNAGIGTGKTVLETSNAECERLLRVNLFSHFVLIREFLPGMLNRKKGHIVTIASMASFVAASGLVDYCVSKVGALYLTEGIRAECLTRYEGGEGICTTSVHPSWHATGIIKGAEKTLTDHGFRIDPASNVSDAVLEQVLRGRSGRLVVPKSDTSKTGVRNLPTWLQDILLGYAFKRKGAFAFAREDTKGIV